MEKENEKINAEKMLALIEDIKKFEKTKALHLKIIISMAIIQIVAWIIFRSC